MKLLPALVSLVPQSYTLGVESDLTPNKQLEVMPSPFAISGTDNLLSMLIHNQLNLERVSLLLATVKTLLITLWTLNR